MIKHMLNFSVHNQSLAPSYSVPELDQYQSQKNIQVVSANKDPLFFGRDCINQGDCLNADGAAAHRQFFALRLQTALAYSANSGKAEQRADCPTYFPGAVIPSAGGAHCKEFERGNLLFDQFQHLLSFDSEMLTRISAYPSRLMAGQTVLADPPLSRLFCQEANWAEPWLWQYIEAPKLYFVHQAPAEAGPELQDRLAAEKCATALGALHSACENLLTRSVEAKYSDATLTALFALISNAWFSPSSGIAPVSWDSSALAEARLMLERQIDQEKAVNAENLLPFLFELEAIVSHVSLGERRESFASGVFAGNFIDVSLAPLTSIKATEFCVRERLFDEVINLSSRGFAPVVINEYGLVADGNHRLTAAYVWNILKYAQDLEWSLDSIEFQKRIAAFPAAVEAGLLNNGTTVSPVSIHQALGHLASFLCRPDWRARLTTYTRPLLKRHDFIHELPVVLLPEYLSGAVVKSLYDEGKKVERACPSIYQAMSLNEHLVLPPRASYHFTDAALLPWFTVLKSSSGAVNHRTGRFGRRARIIPNKKI
ncbi:MAG: hypothetical protein KGS72_02800 [Cyanobacteria bacterium REEB67]|nr:hypothetical protein [Cyanobacteria bacterium REEB67]